MLDSLNRIEELTNARSKLNFLIKEYGDVEDEDSQQGYSKGSDKELDSEEKDMLGSGWCFNYSTKSISITFIIFVCFFFCLFILKN